MNWTVEVAEQLVQMAEDKSIHEHHGEDLPLADRAALLAKIAPTTACALFDLIEDWTPAEEAPPSAPFPLVETPPGGDPNVKYRRTPTVSDDYCFGDDGSCWGPQSRLKPRMDPRTGRPWVCVTLANGKRTLKRVQLLCCQAHHGLKPAPKGHLTYRVCHKHEDKTNNCASNIYWGTQDDDKRDRKRQKTHDVPHRRTTKEEIETIIRLSKEGRSHRAIFLETGVKHDTVRKMLKRLEQATALLAIPAAQLPFASQSPVQ